MASPNPPYQKPNKCNSIQPRSVQSSQHRKYLASSGNDTFISLWNMNNSRRNITLDGHDKKITSLAFSSNQNVLASASYDNTVKLWYPGSNIKSRTIKGHTAPIRSVVFSTDGKTIITGSDDKSVKLWDIDTLKFRGSFIGHNNWVNSANMNVDMSLVCSGGEDKKLIIWDVEKKKLIQKYDCFDGVVTCVKFHPKDELVYASTQAKTISGFDLRSEKMVQHYQAHHDAIKSFDLHPEGGHMISTSANSEIKVQSKVIQIWDIKKGVLTYTMYSHSGQINSVTSSKKGDYFATGGSDCNLLVWRSAFCQPVGQCMKEKMLCQSGHRTDLRTIVNVEQCMRKRTRITPTVSSINI